MTTQPPSHEEVQRLANWLAMYGEREDAAMVLSLLADNVRLSGEVERLRGLVYVPGFWQCKKCGLGLTKSILNVGSSGPLVASDEAPEACPNCNVPMWRVSERDQRREAQQEYEKIFDERDQLRARIGGLENDEQSAKDVMCGYIEQIRVQSERIAKELQHQNT